MGHLLECEYSQILEEDKGVGEIHIHMPDLEKTFKSCTSILPHSAYDFLQEEILHIPSITSSFMKGKGLKKGQRNRHGTPGTQQRSGAVAF